MNAPKFVYSNTARHGPDQKEDELPSDVQDRRVCRLSERLCRVVDLSHFLDAYKYTDIYIRRIGACLRKIGRFDAGLRALPTQSFLASYILERDQPDPDIPAQL